MYIAWSAHMTLKGSDIEVTVVGQAAVVRFRRTECLLLSNSPEEDVGGDLFALVDKEHYSLIIISFENPDILWLSGSFLGLLVRLHVRMKKVNGVLKLCNVPEKMMEQLRTSRLIEVFSVYPNLEAALKSDI
jgi:hypothetical protein